jgi:Prokaryotic N-terminal methylation motif
MNLFLTARARAGRRDPRRSNSDAGSTLVEVVVSMLIMATLAAGLLSMSAIALTQSENQGHLAARTAEYAQDKMEQLLVLAYGDSVTDTRVFPAASLGGTGLAVGGSSNPATPALGYADYLDANGTLLVSNTLVPPAGWFYQRVWQVTNLSATLKEVRVTATVARSIGRTAKPTATLVSIKTFPF